MRFSIAYARILLSLPPEFRGNAINYDQLEKLIQQVVQELTLLGFGPDLVRNLVREGNDVLRSMREVHDPEKPTPVVTQPHATTSSGLKLLYEVDNALGHLVPRLRLIINNDIDVDTALHIPILASLEHSPADSSTREYIIPLASDTAFFDVLMSTMNGLSHQLSSIHSRFMADLDNLSKSISANVLPMSQVDPSYRPFTAEDHPGAITIPSTRSVFGPKLDDRSDLYLWRQLLNLYIDVEVFESLSERNRGERSLEEVEMRMSRFLERVEKSDLLRGKSKKSRIEVDAFLSLNRKVLDLKRLNYANSEAIRKILKKHAKRTALPFPSSLTNAISSAISVEVPVTAIGAPPASHALIPLPHNCALLPQLLVQAIGDNILPIVPHVDDYSCVICMSLAFKPIRLLCRHLFCVRCLVKLQKQGKTDCPMCRSPCVLTANRSNLDLGLMNFMADWFPVEAREKLKSNEQEVNAELMEHLWVGGGGCLLM